MSYDKFSAGLQNASEPAKIRFWYTTDELFNSVSLRTTYRANMVKTGDGAAELDSVAISQDERDIMVEFLGESIYDVGAELFKITEGIDLSVFVNNSILTSAGIPISPATLHTSAVLVTSATLGEIFQVITTPWGGFVVGDIVVCTFASVTAPTFEKCNWIASGFEIVDNKAFNANLLPSIDKKIENYLRYSIMREWYASTGLANDMAINAAMAKDNLIRVKNLTFQLRKPLMS